MEYTGIDNLEVMKFAVNYNTRLINLVLEFCQGAQQVLDFGAGIGTYCEPLSKAGFNVDCLEIDPQLVSALQKNGFNVYTDSKEVTPQKYDAIYSINVLEHTPDDRQILSHFFNWLKPGGRLLIYVPAFMHLYSSMDKKVGHQRRYSKSDLLKKALQAGFDVQECGYADSLGYLATVAYKAFGSDKGDINPQGLKMYDRYAFPVSLKLDHLFKSFFGKNLFLVATKK